MRLQMQSLNLRYNATSFHRNNTNTVTVNSMQDLHGKSIAVIGLGKSGKAAAELAIARGASVLAIDQKPDLCPLEHDPVFKLHSSSVRTVLGEFDGELLDHVDLVVVSPGVPLDKFGLSSLILSGKPVMSELDFAAEVLPESIKILAVTGTNGKSTTVTFSGQAFVGGNLSNPLSEAALQCLKLPAANPKFRVAVVEVSSYQMEIPPKNFHPSVAVVLNLTPDHLERHKTMSNYAAAKCRLFSSMNHNKLGIISSGNEILNEAVREHMNKFNLARIGASPGMKIDMEARKANFEVPAIELSLQLDLSALMAVGTHNYQNAAVAALSILGLDVGVPSEAISSAIAKLRPPPHRMEVVCEDINGVKWINDSKATNVEATNTAIMGLKGQKSVILLGGQAKVLHGQKYNGFDQLVEPLKCHRCVVTFGSSGPMIHKALSDNGLNISCVQAENLKDAVGCAKRMARHGDAILLSPGCASFDEFKNFEHRGAVFRGLVMSS